MHVRVVILKGMDVANPGYFALMWVPGSQEWCTPHEVYSRLKEHIQANSGTYKF